jgi:hypothetical protein
MQTNRGYIGRSGYGPVIPGGFDLFWVGEEFRSFIAFSNIFGTYILWLFRFYRTTPN